MFITLEVMSRGMVLEFKIDSPTFGAVNCERIPIFFQGYWQGTSLALHDDLILLSRIGALEQGDR